MNQSARGAQAAGDDERWMQKALGLARKGRGSARPNPMVGAVVLSESGEVVGAGWHRGPGKPHAEVLALEEAGEQAEGSSIFVNLEPCIHRGRTPPCVDALLRAGVATVICSMEDPDPRVSGRGIAALRQAGIEVRLGVGEAQARELNRSYVVHRSQNRPYVTLKTAISLDGRTSALEGSSKWITGEAARRDVHRLRASSDAVCAGIGTVLFDDPALTVRAPGSTGRGPGSRRRKHTRRVVVDSLGRTPPEARVLKDGAPTLVYVSQRAPRDRVAALEAAGADIVTVPSDSTGLSVGAILRDLAEKSVMDLLVEGGPKLAGSFAALSAIDRYVFYLAPKLLGGPGTGPVLDGWAARSIGDARSLRIASSRRLDADFRIEAFPSEALKGGFDEAGM